MYAVTFVSNKSKPEDSRLQNAADYESQSSQSILTLR